jgi:hypothetical protein
VRATAASELEATKLRVAFEVIDLAAEVRAAYYGAQAAEQTAAMRALVNEAAQTSAAIAKKQAEAGNMNDLALSSELALAVEQTLALRRATTEAAVARTEQFASNVLGKQVVRCSDRSGFVVNALLVPYLLSAIRMVEAGFATVEDVDKSVIAGLSHPMGPLRLSDLVGLDTLKLIADKMFEEFKEPHYGPPPLLLRMVEAGQLGKKSGQGFYKY